jgi:hypothetical protein
MRKRILIITLVIMLIVVGGGVLVLKDMGNTPIKAVVAIVKPKPADKDPNAVKQAVISYSNAYLGGHGNAAYNLLSAKCASQISVNEMIGLALDANQAYGNLQPTDITVGILGDGNAIASYSYPTASSINKHDQSWVYERGIWRYNGCTD